MPDAYLFFKKINLLKQMMDIYLKIVQYVIVQVTKMEMPATFM